MSADEKPEEQEKRVSKSDQDLLKKATYAGRDMTAMTVLAALGSIVVCVGAFAVKDSKESIVLLFSPVVAICFLLLTVGYGFLAVAAKRGESKAVGIPALFLIILLTLNLIMTVANTADNPEAFGRSIASFLIPFLITYVLARDYDVLRKLKKRDLWEQVFGNKPPARTPFLVGSVLFIVGSLGVQGGFHVTAARLKAQVAIEQQHVDSFVKLLTVNEREFMQELQEVFANPGPEQLKKTKAAAASLVTETEKLLEETTQSDSLHRATTLYLSATKKWQSGVSLLESDFSEAQKHFQQGDQLREQAAQLFDKTYGRKK